MSLRAGDSRHGWHGAVCEHAGPLHQERAGVRGGVQSDQPPDLPGHQTHAGPDRAGEGDGESADPVGGEQDRPGESERGAHGGGHGSGPDLGLSLR